MSNRSQEILKNLESFDVQPEPLSELLKSLKNAPPSHAELETLRDKAPLIAAVGLVEDLLNAVQSSRATFPVLVAQIETLAQMASRPCQAAVALRSMPFTEAMRGFDVINACTRGDLDGAIRAAQDQNWFLDDANVSHGFAYAIWVLLMQERFDEANTITRRWEEAHFGKSPRGDYQIRHMQALLAASRDDFATSVRLLEEGYNIARGGGLTVEALFEQARLAATYAHAGNMEMAHDLMRSWGEFSETSQVDAVRALARAEIAVLEQDWDIAEYATQFLTNYHRRNPMFRMHALFLSVLAADENTFSERLTRFAETVTQHPNRRMLRRLADLERLSQAGLKDPRKARVLFITRTRRTYQPLARVWFPIAVQKGGIFIDCVRKLLFIRGRGPFDPHVCPKRFDLLITLLKTPGMRMPIANAFQLVWEMPYDARRHENKVHVTVHRLRKQLEDLAGEAVNSIRVRDGYLEIAPELDAFILDFPSDYATRVPEQTLEEQILMTLTGGVIMAPRELEALIDVHRSTLQTAIRNLIDAGQVEKVGKGRATAYRRCVCAP